MIKSRKANKSGLAICKFTYMGGITYGRFRTDRIRNVVLLGHSGSGKTSLTEAMAYLSGMTNRLGKVTDGNTVSDFDKEEIKRKCSISTTLVPVVWGKIRSMFWILLECLIS